MNTQSIAFQHSGPLGVVHLLDAECDTIAMAGSRRAFTDKLVEVREVSDAGNVNLLIVENRSDELVLLIDGDVLEGAKQTRVLNSSVLLAPRSKTKIPVSCVEAGRWRFTSRSFSQADYCSPSRLRGEKTRRVSDSLRTGRGHASDQGEVWDSVARYHASADTRSSTESLSDMYRQRSADLDAVMKAFVPHPEANGFALFIGRRLLSVDLFNRRDVCADCFLRVVRGAAAEAAIMAEGKEQPPAEAEARYRAVEFLDRIEALESTTHAGVALGEERRFGNNEVAGFVLLHEGRLVHLSALNVSVAA
jgi:hypothetical protein